MVLDLLFKGVQHFLHPRLVVRQLFHCNLHSPGHSDRQADRLGAGPQALLLRATSKQRFGNCLITIQQGTDPARTVELVSCNRHAGDTKFGEVGDGLTD